MKKFILLSALLTFSAVISQAQHIAKLTTSEKPVPKRASFTWQKTTHNFGKIPQGKPVTVAFQFKNSGTESLLLTDVKGSCGCTVVDYPHEAIAPGKTGLIKATYNAANMGAFNKTVTVTANTESAPTQLTLQGEVVAETK